MVFDKATKKALEGLYNQIDQINKELVRLELPIKALENRKLAIYETIIKTLEREIKENNKFESAEV